MEPNLTALTAFQVGVRVARVYVEEGQFVKKGQILAESMLGTICKVNRSETSLEAAGTNVVRSGCGACFVYQRRTSSQEHSQDRATASREQGVDVTPSTVERCRVFSFETGALSASFRAAQQLPADQQQPILFLSKLI